MTNKEVLEKAIAKAIDGGWRSPWLGRLLGTDSDVITGEVFVRFQHKDLPVFKWSLFGLIYSHDFAKALWGGWPTGKEFLEGAGVPIDDKHWGYHLQQMVIADDPIQYLGENI